MGGASVCCSTPAAASRSARSALAHNFVGKHDEIHFGARLRLTERRTTCANFEFEIQSDILVEYASALGRVARPMQQSQQLEGGQSLHRCMELLLGKSCKGIMGMVHARKRGLLALVPVQNEGLGK